MKTTDPTARAMPSAALKRGAIGLAGPSALSLDAALGFAVDPTLRVALVIAGIVAGLVVLTIPRLATHSRPTSA